MTFRYKHIAALGLLALCTIAPTSLYGQETDSESAEAIVLNAFQALATTSYHFESQTESNSKFILEDETGETFGRTQIEGDVTENGDSDITLVYTTSFTQTEDQSELQVEQIDIDGVVYLNIEDIAQVLSQDDLEDGWQLSDNLLASVESEFTRILLQNIVNTPLFTQETFTPEFIEQITESDPETIDGISMRVFDIALDATALAVDQYDATDGNLTALFEFAIVLASGEGRANYRFWVGTDDGLLYRVDGETYYDLPYQTAIGGSQSTYDVITSTSFTATFSQHSEPVTVEPPL